MVYTYAIGQPVFIIKNKAIYSGTISGIAATTNDFTFKITLAPPGTGDTEVSSANVFLRPDEAVLTLQAQRTACVQRYRKGIKNINDLVSFAFKHDLHRNEDAMTAFRSRAKELGFQLEND